MDTRMSARDLYERGRMLRQAKMYDLALADFRHAIEDPNVAARAHTQVALCHRAMGRHGEAAAALRQALASSALSSDEHLHVLYLLAQTLESLGRYAEALETYGWVRQAKAGFMDVDGRIKQLCAVGRETPPSLLTRQLRSGDLVRICRYLQRQSVALLKWNRQPSRPMSERESSRRHGRQESTSQRRNSPLDAAGRSGVIHRNPLVQRRYARVGIRCRSQFAASTQMLAGEAELRDLSPGGCRLKSSVVVPVGAILVCWIFPHNGVEPLTIEGATVRWSHAQEFGLAFSGLTPQLERQIARVCAKPA